MTTKFPGKDVTLGGVDYVLPALNLNALRAFQGKLEKFSGVMSFDNLQIVAEVVHAALSRNYPDITLDEVGELVDLGNMLELMQTVMGVAGVGEAKGVTNSSTGTNSTAI